MFCFKNKNKDKNELNQSQNQQTSDNIKKNTISLAERRGQKIETFNLPITKEKEDTTIEHIKPLF
tara:strand:+ start:459 stop:653 length:195 start_codon:yes stop_codon:yes gene_type:complete